ncbi:MAG: site-2 protease family protein, partial [Sulfuricaulis sp.]|nr:site-2 protease family protein [Sulfuricaulis sp.]
MSELSLPQVIVVSILPILFAITVHEVAHGWVAKRFGDPTAQRLGRLTLNPFKHIDPVGTVLIPALLLLLKAGFLF